MEEISSSSSSEVSRRSTRSISSLILASCLCITCFCFKRKKRRRIGSVMVDGSTDMYFQSRSSRDICVFSSGFARDLFLLALIISNISLIMSSVLRFPLATSLLCSQLCGGGREDDGTSAESVGRLLLPSATTTDFCCNDSKREIQQGAFHRT